MKMQLSYIKIFGVNFTLNKKNEILTYIKEYLKTHQTLLQLTVFTPNPEMVVEAQRNKVFCEVLNSADINLPDGVGIVWASKLVHHSAKQLGSGLKGAKGLTLSPELRTFTRIPGIDFMEDLVNLAVEKNYPVALIGGWGDTAEMALVNLHKKYPGLEGWAETPPKFQIPIRQLTDKFQIPNQISKIHERNQQLNNETIQQFDLGLNKDYFSKLFERIKSSGVRLVFVGLGAPKQEFFIKKLSSQFMVHRSQNEKPTTNYELRTMNSLIFMSVGGSLDIFAGKVKRAPKLIQKLNLEWAWRLFQEPWRLRRQLRLVEFVLLVLGNKIGLIKQPEDNF